MFKNLDSELILAFITNKSTPHLLKGLAGLSGGLLESYGESMRFMKNMIN